MLCRIALNPLQRVRVIRWIEATIEIIVLAVSMNQTVIVANADWRKICTGVLSC